MTTYNKTAVQREIDRDKRIKGREAKNIHRLLAGWRANINKTKTDATRINLIPEDN